MEKKGLKRSVHKEKDRRVFNVVVAKRIGSPENSSSKRYAVKCHKA